MRMSFSSRRDGRGRGARRAFEAVDTMPPDHIESGEPAEDSTKPATARGWYASSLELRHGLEVTDVPLDTLPDDLIDGFTKW